VQVSNVSSEITTRIEKEQAEKNLFIKEINFKNIEINRLRESYSVLKAENETLNLMLREKQNEVEQLEGRLEEVQLQRDRLEKY
jgi:predicted nuclease with TOPRIM domain